MYFVYENDLTVIISELENKEFIVYVEDFFHFLRCFSKCFILHLVNDKP